MPVQVSYPGVYVEELSSGSHTIAGVPTATTAFIGRAPKGPVDVPMTVTSFGNFEQFFGELDHDYPLSYAVRDFFQNGGSHAIIIRRFKAAAAPAPVNDDSSSAAKTKKGAK
ncbi:MAG: hypothetical protein NE330_13835 [Lentisphaeraceae bacterium]|nr:hypothetical protein [Lentisphaeraceae bacterium]